MSIDQIYKTEIRVVNETDKKIIISTILTFVKVMNFIIFPLSFVIFGYALDWKITDGTIIVVYVVIIIFTLGNLSTLLCYWLTMRKFRNPNKMVLTGIITDKLVLGGKYPKTYIYFGIEKIDISMNYSDELVEIGDAVALHYF